MKKAVFVTGSMRRGGAERVISIVANYFADHGWNVIIVQTLYHGCEYDLDDRIKIIDISHEERNQIVDTLRIVLNLRGIIKKEKPDVVFSFMMAINFVTACACKGLKVRFIPSERNDPSIGRSDIWKKLVNWTYAQSSLTVMQTKRAKEFFPPNIQNKSVIIPNPVCVQEYASLNKDKRIVNVGRLEPQKNQEMLLSVFAKVHSEYPDYILDIYGRGSLEQVLKKQTKELGIENIVNYHGNVKDVHAQISTAELFVLSSDFEGLSNALLEAMMMGLPCISTDVAGARDIIEDGITGLIVPVGDSSALNTAIKEMLGDTSRAYNMGAKARIRTEKKYGISTVCEQWIKIAEV